jgi:hypothetical protein
MGSVPSIVPEARLGDIGPPFGHVGGQGRVHPLPDHPGWLYKRYHDTTPVDPDGLLALVEWRRQLTGRDRRIVDVRTAWPQYVVEHPGGHGVVIRRAPARFFHVFGDEEVGTDLQFACLDTATWGGAGPAGPRTAVAIVYRYAQVLDVLHRNGVVYGDMSHTNMLWTSAPGWPGVFVIDCDAAWLTTGPRGVPFSETPPWIDPWPNDLTAERLRRLDLFKLGQLFLRTYYHWPGKITATTTSLGLHDEPPVTRRITDLLTASLRRDRPHQPRPRARDWLDPLVVLERHLRARSAG